MFKRLKIENVQSLKSVEFELSPTLNIIVGSSNVGKSAVMRALSFLFLGKPSQKSLLRSGADFFRIEVETERGRIVRERGGSINRLSFGGQLFENFGRNLPPEFWKFLGFVLPEEAYAAQFSPPFLLSLPESQVGLYFSELCPEFGKLDLVISELQGSLRSKRQKVKELKEERERIRKDLEKFRDLDRARELLREVKAQEAELLKRTQLLLRLRRLKSRLETLENRVSELFITTQSTNLEMVEGMLNQLELLANRLHVVKGLGERIARLQQRLRASAVAEQIELPDIETLERDFKKLQRLYEVYKLREREKQLVGSAEEVERRLKELERTVEERIGDRCPLCNQPVKPEQILRGLMQ